MRNALLIATAAATFAVFAPAASSAANPPQQGCPAFNLTLFAGPALGQGLRAIATPGTPGGVGQAVQAFCGPRP